MPYSRGTSLLHLVRVQDGWQVRLPLWHPQSQEGVPYSELFSDRRYGGRARAEAAARCRRDELFEQARLPLRLAGNTTHAKSTSGLVGVKLSFDEKRTGAAAFRWVASWGSPTTGTDGRASFSVATHGFRKALELAIAARQARTGVRFDAEQRAAAMSLEEEVQTYIRTGRRSERQMAAVGPVLPSRAAAAPSR